MILDSHELQFKRECTFLECTNSERLTLMCTCVPGLEEVAAQEIQDKLKKLNDHHSFLENHGKERRNDSELLNSFSWLIHHIYSVYPVVDKNLQEGSILKNSSLREANREIVRLFERKDVKSMLQGKIIVQLEFNQNFDLIFKRCVDALLQCISISKIHIMVYTMENLSFPSQEKSTEDTSNIMVNSSTEPLTDDEKKEREYERRLKNDPQFRYIMEIHHQYLPNSRCWKESLFKWMQMRNLLYSNKEEHEQLQDIENLKFRITAKRAGSHQFTSKELSSYIGLLISHKSMGLENAKIGQSWKADLSNYDLDIYSYLFFDTLFVCFTLCEENVCYETFSRNFNHELLRNSTSLKPNIAYSLIQLANIREGDIVCDICCGTGIISLMAAHLFYNRIHVICGDYSEEVLEKTIHNMNCYVGRKHDKIHLMSPQLWDFTQLPLQTASVDVICSNLPFGKQIGSHSLNKEIYPPMFIQVCRVLRPNGRAVLLTTEKHLMQKSMSENKVFISLNKRVTINQGGSEVFVYIIDRKNREWFVKNDSTK
ncbi:hypothetical protein C9374_011709 [Naegleria lovaniensis]|uniref:Ribosomal RNA large subunit methyltransferase K/L-like methyltransferase domain-containing protein n=1 Tax=Naegleria lovaniensis TaxID=51637 RepID=A0AA88GEB4_NAELO|nr:uncharacterized protein C9374_011709 [Naegleria lovaniensis]KAG2373824.1 hypothetical protein C9374_011709 [Naegleria lovaniensis]